MRLWRGPGIPGYWDILLALVFLLVAIILIGVTA